MTDIPNHYHSNNIQSKPHHLNHPNLKPYQIEIQHNQIHLQNQLPNKNILGGSSKLSKYAEDKDRDQDR